MATMMVAITRLVSVMVITMISTMKTTKQHSKVTAAGAGAEATTLKTSRRRSVTLP